MNGTPPHPAWRPVEIPYPKSEARFVTRDPASDGIRVAYYWDDADDAFVGQAWFGPETLGPPGHAHGGASAALLNDCMGTACWVKGTAVLAASIAIQFRSPLPLNTEVRWRCKIDGREGRKFRTNGVVETIDGTLLAEGTGLYIEMSAEQIEDLRQRARRA